MDLKIKLLKPYLFILIFLGVPLLIFQGIKHFITSNYDESQIINPSEIKSTPMPKTSNKCAILIHSGLAFTDRSHSDALIASKTKLYQTIQQGKTALEKGDSAQQVIIEIIKKLENSPYFYAGKAAGLTKPIQCNTCIADGKTNKTLALVQLSSIKNPVETTFSLMTYVNNELYFGEKIVNQYQNIEINRVKPSYFVGENTSLEQSFSKSLKNIKNLGGVYCMVSDKFGNLTVACSQSQISSNNNGAIDVMASTRLGVFADNKLFAIAFTGSIVPTRPFDLPKSIIELMQSKALSFNRAVKALSQQKLIGICGIDKKGNTAIASPQKGLLYGSWQDGQEPIIDCFK